MTKNYLRNDLAYKQICHHCKKIYDFIPDYPLHTIHDFHEAPDHTWWEFTLEYDGKIWCPTCYYWIGPGREEDMKRFEIELERARLYRAELNKAREKICTYTDDNINTYFFVIKIVLWCCAGLTILSLLGMIIGIIVKDF